MKQLALTAAASLVLASCVGVPEAPAPAAASPAAPAPAPAAASSATLAAEAQLKALDDEWRAAEVNHDRATLERILHEDFLITYASGRTLDRSGFINDIMGGGIPPFQVVHDRIRVIGDIAIVIDEIPSNGVKATWIAIRRDGKWRVISETMMRIPAAR